MILTQRQLDVLNHVVEDGQAWADNAKEEAHVLAKVARWEADYDAKVAQGNYKNRLQREAEFEATTQLNPANWSPLKKWKHDIAKSDMTMIPRWLEDHLRDDHGGVAGNAQLQAKYDQKVALRNSKPS